MSNWVIYVAICEDCFKLIGGPTPDTLNIKATIKRHKEEWAVPHTKFNTYGRLAEPNDHEEKQFFKRCRICHEPWPCTTTQERDKDK